MEVLMFFVDKKSIWRRSFVLLSLLWLTACGEFEIGIADEANSGQVEVTVVTTVIAAIPEGMVLVTVTPPGQATPMTTTSTPTALLIPAATHTPLSQEATAVPTSSLPTSTRIPFATSVLATPTTPPYPEIITYPTVSAIVWPGDSVEIDYQTQADSVTLCVAPVFTQDWSCRPAPESGPYTMNIPAATTTNLHLRLLAMTNGSEVEATGLITLYCPENDWFFTGPPTTCPGGPPVETAAAYQRFERGVMLWLEDGQWWEDSSVIYVFYDEPSPYYEAFTESTMPPANAPTPNNEYDPPDGLFVPESGFGLLWRENSWIRQKIGWALAPEVAYTATVQKEYSQDDATVYLLGRENKLLILNMFNNTWSERNQP